MPTKRRRSKSPVPGSAAAKKRMQRTYSVPDSRYNYPHGLQTSSAPITPIGTKCFLRYIIVLYCKCLN